MTAKTASWIAGSLVMLCIAILFIDYAVATRLKPQDDKLVKALQEQTKSDASTAPHLAAEKKRITNARLSRKTRDNVIAWVLIAAAAAFLTCAKRIVKPAGDDRPRITPTPLPGRSRERTVTAPPELDLTFVDQIVSKIGRGKETAIPLLQAIQTHYRYLPDEALRRLCELTEITPAEIAGTSSFYGQFRRSPVGEHVVRVCHGTACHVSGARQITEELRRHLDIPEGADTDAERRFTLDEVACLGCCSLAPVLMVDSHTAGKLTPSTACDALKVTA